MRRNSNEFVDRLRESGAVFSNVTVDAEGSIIVDSLTFPQNGKLLNVDTTLCSRGNINVGDLNIKGNLTCEGYMDAARTTVKGCLVCKGDVNIEETIVFGDFICEGNIDSNGQLIMIYGDFVCKGNCSANVMAKQEFTCKGEHTGKRIWHI